MQQKQALTRNNNPMQRKLYQNSPSNMRKQNDDLFSPKPKKKLVMPKETVHSSNQAARASFSAGNASRAEQASGITPS